MQVCCRYILSIIAIGFILILGTRASAEDNAGFLKIIQDPAYQQHVRDAAQRSTVVLKFPCPSAKFTLTNNVVIHEPIEFDSADKLAGGAWKQVVSETGCGIERQLNIYLVFDKDAHSLKVFPILPGTTKADFTLQMDARQYAFIAATRPEDKDCQEKYIIDTKYLQETVDAPMPGAKNKPWDELWTLVVCGKKALVTMHFIPDKTGTTIAAGIAETKFVP